MRKHILSFAFFALPVYLGAQTFNRAPSDKKTLKQIVEWTTFPADHNGSPETIKDAIYQFRKDGLLEKWFTNNADDEVYTYEYNAKGQLVKTTIDNGSTSRLLTYRYFEDRKIAEIQEKDLDVRNVQYLNDKKQVIEEKTFAKGTVTGEQWVTMKRVLYNYKEDGKLFGETIYQYNGSTSPRKSKVIHEYRGPADAISKSTHFDTKGLPYMTVTYSYNKDGLLEKKEVKNPAAHFSEKTTHLYKAGESWQVITQSADYKTEKIFKEGRLIRLKEYNKEGKLLWHTDYQYIYY